MSKRKKHHYVPRFYLKRFSINYEGKVIGLYNHKNKIFVQNAPLKSQAYEDFLYGQNDEIEAELAKIENQMAKLFYYWTDERILITPPENTKAFILLKRFILYQLFRTTKAGNDMNELITLSFQTYVQACHPERIEELSGGKAIHKNPTLLALLFSADKEHLLNFMSCKFIVNLSQLSFISSDSPVIMYNQFMEKRGSYIGATSLVAMGLQIFYPIHPRLMICFYDPKVYSCGEDNLECISTESIEDINQLNALQYINSNSQLFFDETIEQKYNEDIIERYGHKKNKPRNISEIIKTKSKVLAFFSFEDESIDLELSFFKMLDKIEDSTEIVPLRHPSLTRDNY